VVRAFLWTLDATLLGTVCINAIDDIGEVAEHPEVLEQARVMGIQLASRTQPGYAE
jgi:hypothetical protein